MDAPSTGRVTNRLIIVSMCDQIASHRCVFEAYKAGEQKISNVSISGEPVQLLTGDRREALRHEELCAQDQRDNEMSSMKAELDERLASPELLSDEAMADVTFGTQLKAFRATAERVATAKLDVLTAPDSDLIDLEQAECSWDGDRVMICDAIKGCEAAIRTLVVSLIRDVVCGVGYVPKDATVAPGSLALSLVEPIVDLSLAHTFKDDPLRLLQFAGWLRLRPHVEELTIDVCQITPKGSQIFQQAYSDGLLRSIREIKLTNGTDVQLKSLANHVARRASPQTFVLHSALADLGADVDRLLSADRAEEHPQRPHMYRSPLSNLHAIVQARQQTRQEPSRQQSRRSVLPRRSAPVCTGDDDAPAQQERPRLRDVIPVATIGACTQPPRDAPVLGSGAPAAASSPRQQLRSPMRRFRSVLPEVRVRSPSRRAPGLRTRSEVPPADSWPPPDRRPTRVSIHPEPFDPQSATLPTASDGAFATAPIASRFLDALVDAPCDDPARGASNSNAPPIARSASSLRHRPPPALPATLRHKPSLHSSRSRITPILVLTPPQRAVPPPPPPALVPQAAEPAPPTHRAPPGLPSSRKLRRQSGMAGRQSCSADADKARSSVRSAPQLAAASSAPIPVPVSVAASGQEQAPTPTLTLAPVPAPSTASAPAAAFVLPIEAPALVPTAAPASSSEAMMTESPSPHDVTMLPRHPTAPRTPRQSSAPVQSPRPYRSAPPRPCRSSRVDREDAPNMSHACRAPPPLPSNAPCAASVCAAPVPMPVVITSARSRTTTADPSCMSGRVVVEETTTTTTRRTVLVGSSSSSIAETADVDALAAEGEATVAVGRPVTGIPVDGGAIGIEAPATVQTRRFERLLGESSGAASGK